MNSPTYIQHIHHTHRQAIKEYYEQRYSLSELLIMYRDILHDNERIAKRQLRALTKGLERVERV